MNHAVRVQLHIHYDIDYVAAYLRELKEIREWLDELVYWQPNKYEIKYVGPDKLDIWFEEEKHAIMCTLRWT